MGSYTGLCLSSGGKSGLQSVVYWLVVQAVTWRHCLIVLQGQVYIRQSSRWYFISSVAVQCAVFLLLSTILLASTHTHVLLNLVDDVVQRPHLFCMRFVVKGAYVWEGTFLVAVHISMSSKSAHISGEFGVLIKDR